MLVRPARRITFSILDGRLEAFAKTTVRTELSNPTGSCAVKPLMDPVNTAGPVTTKAAALGGEDLWVPDGHAFTQVAQWVSPGLTPHGADPD